MISYNDYMLLYRYGAVDDEVIKEMVTSSKRKYIEEHHNKGIFEIQNGKLKGFWKTYIGSGSERRQIVKKTYDDVVNALYDYYNSSEDVVTLQSAFNEWLSYKTVKSNLSKKTQEDYIGLFNLFGEKVKNKKLSDIDEDDLEDAIIDCVESKRPSSDRLRRAYNALERTFEYGMRRRYTDRNPALYVDVEAYYKSCRNFFLPCNTKEFTPDEIEMIRSDVIKTKPSAVGLMTLFASYTGMRAGEICALHKDDIVVDKDGNEYLHIHRQQSKMPLVELPYTKDERHKPKGGRYFPISPEIKTILFQSQSLEGESEYVFHDRQGNWINKDTYEQNLNRRCKRLGINKSNNHAFRMALNSYFIDKGLSSAERAVLLGHTVRTNEQVYSLAGVHRVKTIAKKLSA